MSNVHAPHCSCFAILQPVQAGLMSFTPALAVPGSCQHTSPEWVYYPAAAFAVLALPFPRTASAPPLLL